MWKPPEYPGPCFDLHFDRFDGLIFEAEKPFENVCATGASPVAGHRTFPVSSLTLELLMDDSSLLKFEGV